jgi:4'-phosphopantetheinyl transferase
VPTVYRIDLDRPARFGCADAVLRTLLRAQLGAEPEIVVGPRGKPALAGGEIAFSIAHSGTLALIAIGVGEVGIDVEQHRPRDVIAIARRFFTADEVALVAVEPREFYRLWCRKEALVKARGTGLVLPLPDVRDVAGLVDLDVTPGYSAAIYSDDIRRSGEAISILSASR